MRRTAIVPGLAVAAVLLAGCGTKSSDAPVPTKAATMLASSAGTKGNAVVKLVAAKKPSPATLHVRVNKTVTWKNETGRAVVMKSTVPTWIFQQAISKGGTVHFRFSKPGIYSYRLGGIRNQSGTIIASR
jgi:plastocyanin